MQNNALKKLKHVKILSSHIPRADLLPPASELTVSNNRIVIF